MTQLYKLTEQHAELSKLAEDADDDLLVAIADTFESLEGEFNDKAISLVYVVKSIDSDSNEISNEIKRLQARKKAIDTRQDTLKEYLRSNMEAFGITKISCPLFSITLGKGRDMVEIIDEDKIPTDYLDVKTIISPMKREMLADLKKGVEIPGAGLIKSKTSLLIT